MRNDEAGGAIDRRGLMAASLASMVCATPGIARQPTRHSPFLLGADVTWLAEDEAAGAEYWVNGRRWDLLALLRASGFNAIKLRCFVDPTAPGGYSARAPDRAWGGVRQTIAIARRVRQHGMRFALSLHFSDSWADPQKQVKPAAWASLRGDALDAAVRAHARDTVRALVAAGVAPDSVVIGNETTFGMLWPDGRVPLTRATGNPVTDATHLDPGPDAGGFDRFARMLTAGIGGVRDVHPAAKIVVHNHLGRHWPILSDWVDALRARRVPFNAVGLSCYQQATEGDWAGSFASFCRRYPDLGLVVAEYSSRKRYVNDLVHELPNGQGWGSYIWEPTRHQEAIFDLNGRNAGGGPKPNLISQGMNAAEAPGGVPAASPGSAGEAEPPPGTYGVGGRYEGNGFLDLYRRIARDYRLT